jgi:hypothetical protein
MVCHWICLISSHLTNFLPHEMRNLPESVSKIEHGASIPSIYIVTLCRWRETNFKMGTIDINNEKIVMLIKSISPKTKERKNEENEIIYKRSTREMIICFIFLYHLRDKESNKMFFAISSSPFICS